MTSVDNREPRPGRPAGIRRGSHWIVVFSLLLAVATLAACSDPTGEAQELEGKGDLAGAVAVYRDALQRDPDNVAILSALAADLNILGRYDEALPIQEKVVALDPRDAQTRVELGFNYLNHQKRPADAVRVLAEAASLEPTAKHLTFLAQAQIVSGDTANAEQSLHRALDTDPKYVFSYMVLENLLVSQGRTAEAAALKELAGRNGVTLSSTP